MWQNLPLPGLVHILPHPPEAEGFGLCSILPIVGPPFSTILSLIPVSQGFEYKITKRFGFNSRRKRKIGLQKKMGFRLSDSWIKTLELWTIWNFGYELLAWQFLITSWSKKGWILFIHQLTWFTLRRFSATFSVASLLQG